MQKPVILDGSLGMELEARGFHCCLPLWSAWALLEAPYLIREIHGDYLRAGAEVLTTATFRCTRYMLAQEGLASRTQELTNLAVQLAREAIQDVNPGHEVRIAGSLATLLDCYKPELTSVDGILESEHTANAEAMAAAGADLILVETQNSAREALIASRAALAVGKPVWTSLMPCSASELFNGDSLPDTARELASLGVDALLINCCEPRVAAQAFATLRKEFPTAVLGVYPNNLDENITPELIADWALQLAPDAQILGGCCGIGPEHLRMIVDKLNGK